MIPYKILPRLSSRNGGLFTSFVTFRSTKTHQLPKKKKPVLHAHTKYISKKTDNEGFRNGLSPTVTIGNCFREMRVPPYPKVENFFHDIGAELTPETIADPDLLTKTEHYFLANEMNLDKPHFYFQAISAATLNDDNQSRLCCAIIVKLCIKYQQFNVAFALQIVRLLFACMGHKKCKLVANDISEQLLENMENDHQLLIKLTPDVFASLKIICLASTGKIQQSIDILDEFTESGNRIRLQDVVICGISAMALRNDKPTIATEIRDRFLGPASDPENAPKLLPGETRRALMTVYSEWLKLLGRKFLDKRILAEFGLAEIEKMNMEILVRKLNPSNEVLSALKYLSIL